MPRRLITIFLAQNASVQTSSGCRPLNCLDAVYCFNIGFRNSIALAVGQGQAAKFCTSSAGSDATVSCPPEFIVALLFLEPISQGKKSYKRPDQAIHVKAKLTDTYSFSYKKALCPKKTAFVLHYKEKEESAKTHLLPRIPIQPRRIVIIPPNKLPPITANRKAKRKPDVTSGR